MKKACILGGGGYFGQAVACKFQAEGYHVNLLDLRFESPPPGMQVDSGKMTKFEGSILDEKLLESALSDCEVCVHIAAYGMGGTAALNRDMVFRVNLDGTLLILAKCKQLGVKRLVNSSSVGVIFTDQELNMVDESFPYPRKYYSYYSESKMMAERAVKAANSPELLTVSLRYRGIFGPGEPRATSRAAEIIYRGLYIVEFDQKRPTMTQYSGLENTAEACVLADRAMKERPQTVGGKVYTIVDGGDPVESSGFWYPLIERLGRSRPFIHVPFIAMFYLAWLCELAYHYLGIPPALLRLEVALMAVTNTYSIEAAKRDLNYEPKNNHDISELCDYYANFYQKNPSWRIDWTIVFVIISFSLFTLIYTLL